VRDVLSLIPQDNEVNNFDRIKKSLLELRDSSPCIAAVSAILEESYI